MKNELLNTFEAMAAVAQESDPIRIEVRFASDTSRLRRGLSLNIIRFVVTRLSVAAKVDQYVEQVREHFASSPAVGDSPSSPCDMEVALNRVLGSMRDQLVDARARRHRPSQYSIYVLTDGVWLPDDGPTTTGAGGVENPLLMVTKQLQEHNLTQDHVMVQFVRFGRDRVGKRRMRWLDNDLKKQPKADGYDIVDRRTPRSGIWPIFIGSLNRHEDSHDDSSGDEDDE